MHTNATQWIRSVGRIAAVVVLALGLGAPAAAADTIKVGWIGGLTGPLAQVVQGAKQGSDAAAEEINAAGGLLGQKLELIYADTKIDPQLARQAAQRMVYSDKVTAIIGDYFTPNTMAAMDIARDNKVPMVTFSGSDAILRSKNGFISHVVSSTEELVSALGTYALDTMKFKRFAVFTTNDAFGKETADAFAGFVKKRGAQVVGYETYDRATTRDFTNLLAKYKDIPLDAIFFGGAQADSALIAKQARQLGLKTQLIGNYPVSKPYYYAIGGEVIEGTITVSNYIGLTTNLSEFGEESTKAFVTRWEKKYGKPPSDDNAFGYDSMKLLAQAFDQAKSLNGAAGQQALVKIRNYHGALGTVSMAPSGDANIPIYVLRWGADGKLTVLAKFSNGAAK